MNTSEYRGIRAHITEHYLRNNGLIKYNKERDILLKQKASLSDFPRDQETIQDAQKQN